MKIIRCIAVILIIEMIAQSSVFAQGTTGMAYVRGSLVVDQTIASATYTKLNFVALQVENGDWTNGIFTPAHNGRYLFCATTLWNSTSGISTAWQWLLFATLDSTWYEVSRLGGLSGATFPKNTGCISLWMLTSSTVSFNVYQNTGSNRSIASAPANTFFTVTEIPMLNIAQTVTPVLTATPQPTMTPNATIPALATAVAALQTPEATATMEPITETIDISLAITNTTGISISRIPVSNTLHTTGYIYLPGWVLNFDPIAVMASLAVFILVGAVMRKPTLFVISWFGLSILGVFSQSGIYWIFITVVMVTAVVIFLFIRHSQGD